MVASGCLPQQEYDALATATTMDDVVRAFHSALESHQQSRKTPNSQVIKTFEPLMLRLERFTTAIDILVQASPQAFGFNPALVIWGCLKIILIVSPCLRPITCRTLNIQIARDVADTFDLIFETFEDLVHRLPILRLYPEIFKSSKMQLLQEPLTLLYADIIAIWTKTLALFQSGRFSM